MSSTDFWQGVSSGAATGRANARRLRTTIAQWQTYAAELEAKLDRAETLIAEKAAREAGRNAQQLALREALAAVVPNHPLLTNGAVELSAIGNAEMMAEYKRRGFHFDLQTRALTRR
ncbi:hypothetical protein ABWH74_002707 [Burkholderia vietnamiensis]|uniref:hypothetical protein n=1 Tax=Burkholderia vietnamiensis TaxID=60552 RepID=UPI0015939F30|nr:hypothetical protein [Burkholderia vietnamiensis]WHU92235.1 hypothetical protein P4G95_00225 [Burkholderia vietnamiensis]